MVSDHLESIDEAIRAGNAVEALTQLKNINPKSLTRAHLSVYANLCRRLGESNEAIKCLRPYVRSSAKNPQIASDAENLEYGAALINLGAVSEGIRLLDSLSESKHPLKLLYTSFGFISQWRYLEAATVLEAYVGHPEVLEYQALTAKANLLSCYVFAQTFEKVDVLIDELLERSEKSKSALLHRRISLLAVQSHIFRNQWTKAQEFIAKAENSLGTSASPLDYLLLTKWKLILKLNTQQPGDALLGELSDLRTTAQKLKSFETLRDLDFYQSIFFNDRALFEHVYFGTGYESYKAKMLSAYRDRQGCELALPESYRWELLPSNPERGVTNKSNNEDWIDSRTGKNSFSDSYLNNEKMCHKFFQLICSDFYRSLSLYQVYDVLFDEAFFNPISTPNKIRQIVYRLNKWLADNSIPLEVHSEQHFFNIRAHQPLSIVVGRQKAQHPKYEAFLAELNSVFGDKNFSSLEAQKALKVSRRKISYLLKDCVELGVIEWIERGPKSKYQIINPISQL